MSNPYCPICGFLKDDHKPGCRYEDTFAAALERLSIAVEIFVDDAKRELKKTWRSVSKRYINMHDGRG